MTGLEQKLWDRVLIGDECWEWQGGKQGSGYGVVYDPEFPGKRKGHLTHRVAYESLVGKIPLGLQLDHLCRNRRCCNPSHLEPVTRRENILRGTAPVALQARQTHCKRGHEFTEENTIRRSRKGSVMRVCRICSRNYYWEKRYG